MSKILIFAGTYEGHQLCTYCAEHHLQADACVATEYGAAEIGQLEGISVLAGRLSVLGMETLLARGDYRIVVDATHPYATEVTENIQTACAAQKVPYRRLCREDAAISPAVQFVADIEEAVKILNRSDQNVLVTTGSKELIRYQNVKGLEHRLFARVLPTVEAIETCRSLGLSGRQILALQGPFSEELNTAMLREYQCGFLVTKYSGTPGGFDEKVQAAENNGVAVLAIARPPQLTGYTLEEICEELVTDGP